MRVAISHPERLAAMAIFDTNADGPTVRERIEYRALLALARRIGLPPLLVRRKILPLMFSPHTLSGDPAIVEDFMRSLGGFSIEGLARATTAVSIERTTIVDALRTVSIPTLVGCGTEDIASPPVHSRRIASRVLGATLVMVEGAGHLSALEKPTEVNAALIPFVRRHLAARAQN